jgi:hypothetical protein
MFGATAYDCTIGSNEIKWTPSTSSLYVHGNLYFDGSLTNPPPIKYSGQAAMYFSGRITISQSFCEATSNCTSSWNPSQNGIVFAANCTGVSSNQDCVTVSAPVQFGGFVNGNYVVQGSGSNMGPMVCAGYFTLSGGSNQIIPLGTFPYLPGGGSTTAVTGAPPTGWSG